MTDEQDVTCKAMANLTLEHAGLGKSAYALKQLVDVQTKELVKITPASWMHYVVCSRRVKAGCGKSATSGLRSESSYALSAMRSLHGITMYYQRFVGWPWTVLFVKAGWRSWCPIWNCCTRIVKTFASLLDRHRNVRNIYFQKLSFW